MAVAPPAETPAMPGRERFPIRLGRLGRWLLIGWGVWSRDRACVAFEGDDVVVRFGFYGTRFPVSEVERYDVAGPFIWVRAIAVRHTLFKNDVSYLGDAGKAVRLWLRSPRRVWWVRHTTEIYVGVEDLTGFAAELERRGIRGTPSPAA